MTTIKTLVVLVFTLVIGCGDDSEPNTNINNANTNNANTNNASTNTNNTNNTNNANTNNTNNTVSPYGSPMATPVTYTTLPVSVCQRLGADGFQFFAMSSSCGESGKTVLQFFNSSGQYGVLTGRFLADTNSDDETAVIISSTTHGELQSGNGMLGISGVSDKIVDIPQQTEVTFGIQHWNFTVKFNSNLEILEHIAAE